MEVVKEVMSTTPDRIEEMAAPGPEGRAAPVPRAGDRAGHFDIETVGGMFT